MKLLRTLGVLAAVSFAAWGMTTPANAQATRTWVSGVGDDANPCSRTAPCKTFAGAISKTAAGGEIDALDPGGFGALTITKSITLDGGGGQVASVLVAGTNGIVVVAGATDVVILRNLRLDGLLGNGSNSGNAGISGIRFISGKTLILEHDDVFGFNTAGVDAEPSTLGANLILEDVHLQNNAGVSASGVLIQPGSGGSIQATLTNVFSDANTNGLTINANAASAHVSVENSTFTSGTNGIQVTATVSSVPHVFLNNVNTYQNSGSGLVATGSFANVLVANSSIHDNGNGILRVSSSTIGTYGNNRLDANTTDGTFNLTLTQK
jgi:hypothetical protein